MYFVRTSAGITLEYFFSTPSKLFSNEKSPKYSPAFAELLYPKSEHTECVTRGFSWYVSTRFFLLSLLPFLSSFFGKKEERNEELNKKELLIEKL